MTEQDILTVLPTLADNRTVQRREFLPTKTLPFGRRTSRIEQLYIGDIFVEFALD
jgi:hypothetical protein